LRRPRARATAKVNKSSAAINDARSERHYLTSGQLALARSGNENIHGYATRAVADANYDTDALRKSRQEAGVSYAPACQDG
jgi:hypothetical protein